MNNLVDIKTANIDPNIIRVLEVVLDRAKSGEFFNIAICATCNDGHTYNVFAGQPNIPLLGVMSYTHGRIQKIVEAQ